MAFHSLFPENGHVQMVSLRLYKSLQTIAYCTNPMFLDRQVLENSADQDETALEAVWSGSSLFENLYNKKTYLFCNTIFGENV